MNHTPAEAGGFGPDDPPRVRESPRRRLRI